MADIASPQNTSSQSLDALVKTAGATPYLKQGKGSKTATGVDDAVAGQVVHFDSSTATLSNVAASATSVTLLASNVERIGATIANDSSAILYVKFGSTASATSYTYQMAASTAAGVSHLEIPYGYTGIITGIWASATGNARVTELTA